MDLDQALDDLFANALKAFGAGHYVATAELLAPYVRHRPDDARAWYWYGDSLQCMGLRDEAERALLRSFELAPEWIRPAIALGRLKLHFGDFEAAEQWFSLALKHPEAEKRGWIWILRGSNFALMNQLERALDCHRHALTQLNVDYDEAYYNIALILRAQGKYEESCAALKRAMELTPDYPEASETLQSLQGAADATAMARQIPPP